LVLVLENAIKKTLRNPKKIPTIVMFSCSS
jgi:hypothetical protein